MIYHISAGKQPWSTGSVPSTPNQWFISPTLGKDFFNNNLASLYYGDFMFIFRHLLKNIFMHICIKSYRTLIFVELHIRSAVLIMVSLPISHLVSISLCISDTALICKIFLKVPSVFFHMLKNLYFHVFLIAFSCRALDSSIFLASEGGQHSLSLLFS